MEKGHPLLYAILACATTPFGGAIAGYMYAKAAREANALRGIEDNTLWHNPIFAACVGAMFLHLSGALYGFAYGEKETEIGQLKMLNAMRYSQGYNAAYYGPSPSRDLGGDYWRDRLAAESQARNFNR